jgi:RNA polymerase sigma-70 factor (ECF subfamily)
MDTDVALAQRLATDLDGTFPTLVADHADRLYSIALRLLGDPRDAEEVAQDALVRAYRAIQGYPRARTGELRLRPWLASITVNLARNRRRRIADRQPPASLEPLVEAGLDLPDLTTPGPATLITRREGATALALTLLQLPAPMRAAVVLRHVDGLSVAETAEVLGRPEGTVKAQVARGLERLRRLLDESASVDGSTTRAATATHARGERPASLDPRSMSSRGLAAAEVLP